MPLAYSLEKKNIISNTETEKLANFIKGVSTPLLFELLKRLPKVNGFRPQKELEIKINKYCKRKLRWTEKDWELMIEIWLAWTESNEAFRHVLNFNSRIELICELESIYENNNLKEVVKKLIQQRGNEFLTRDAISNWLEFSPYLTDSEIDELLELAPSQVEIAQKVKINLLEQRIKQNETELKNIGQQIKAINENSLKITKEYGEIKKEINIRTDEYKLDKESYEREFTGLKNNFDIKLKENKHLVNELDKYITKNISQITSRISEVERKITQVQLDSINLKITEMSDEINRLRNAHSEVLDHIFQMNTEIENIASHTVVTTQQVSKDMYDVKVERLSENDASNEIILSRVEDVLYQMEENLRKTGIILAHARKLSVELLSALISGQMVTFSGSLAITVAEIVAKTLASDSIYVLKIPLGLMSPVSFEIAFKSLISDKESQPKIILIEGINRSTFEVYGVSLHKLITDRLLRINTNLQIFILATITEGPGTLPLSRRIIEIGPIFNTDALTWGDKIATIPAKCKIKLSIFDEVMQDLSSIHLEEEELGLPEWTSSIAGVLWKKAVLNAQRISILLCEKERYKVLGLNITFGWVIPMAFICKKNKLSELQDEIELDDRSKLLIELFGNQEELI